jgi:hypothetical protein
MIHRYRSAFVAGLVIGLSLTTGPLVVAQDPSPPASPAASASPAPTLEPAVSPCPSPSPVASPTPSAAPPGAPESSPSLAPELAPTPSPEAEIPCPGETGSAITIPAGASPEEILALGIGGVELTVQSGGLQFVDTGARWYRQLVRALRSQDKTSEDVVQHIGSSEADGVLVGAFQVRGADASLLVDNAVAWLLEGFPSRRHDREAGNVGGKDVTVVRPARAEGRVIYFYPSGDAVWFVMASEAYIAEFLGALP